MHTGHSEKNWTQRAGTRPTINTALLLSGTCTDVCTDTTLGHARFQTVSRVRASLSSSCAKKSCTNQGHEGGSLSPYRSAGGGGGSTWTVEWGGRRIVVSECVRATSGRAFAFAFLETELNMGFTEKREPKDLCELGALLWEGDANLVWDQGTVGIWMGDIRPEGRVIRRIKKRREEKKDDKETKKKKKKRETRLTQRGVNGWTHGEVWRERLTNC